MKCGICGNELINGITLNADEENYLMTELSCPKCNARVSIIYHENSMNVVCDDCEHRSETCLCDISADNENCPLVDWEVID